MRKDKHFHGDMIAEGIKKAEFANSAVMFAS
jgi:hypothetical protein